MTYQVVWRQTAEDELIRIWLAGPDRERIREIMDKLENQFVERPTELGESRHGNARVLFAGPLRFWFEIDEPARLVTITSVNRVDSR